ncbi:type I restriction-modification system subunit M [Gluconobacter oxydans]|uniref:type I restriction-modification system subunit M n=1 Tax=Gluconobacter oxydans TaxID=442 RepID=UPI00209EE5AA|nr:type I restriction-modification system subunit M [Gluconobacter oxydans]
MAVKKSQIYSSLWKSCDALRGGMDASQYKDYILTLLFLKYVSDRSLSDPDAQITVPEGCHFADMVKLKGTKDIGEEIDKIIAKVAETNSLGGVIDNAKFNDPTKLGDGKDMVDRLSKLMEIFSRPELDFRKNRAEGDDILGDAYEYLMRHFASESGKSKGQFYTPAEVSRIIAKAVGINAATTRQHTIYDPTCGSGSLLLKAHNAAPDGLSIYGQEKDVATFALARMNMMIHNCADAELWRENTLTKPYHKGPHGLLKQFDFIVANPPFSDKAWSTGLNPDEDEFGRFAYRTPPAKNGDYAYLLHVLASMKSTGKAVIVLPHGVLFRGNAEADIRQELLKRGYIKAIIGLPANLFYGTGIPACLVVLDKEHAAARKGIFMIDASKGFVKDGNKNRLRDQDVHKIVDVLQRSVEIKGFSRMVPSAEISKNDGNLNIPRYIDGSEAEDLQDIEAHLKGGIPARDVDALQEYWDLMPGLRGDLFGPGDRPGYLAAKVEPTEVRATIHAHAEFEAFAATVRGTFAAWREANIEAMRSFDKGHYPTDLIHALSEDLLARFREAPLVDAYDTYQHIMTYWSEVMQDDAYQITSEGWDVAKVIRELVKDADGKFTEEPDIVLGSGRSAKKLKAEVIPPSLIVARYFAAEQAEVDELEAKVEELGRQLEELEEEHSGEDGLLLEAQTDAGKLTAASVKARLKAIKGDADAKEELAVLRQWSALSVEQNEAARAFKEAQAELNAMVVKQYARLPDGDAKVLVVEDKWITTLRDAINGELDRTAQALTKRIKSLTERYAVPLPILNDAVAGLEARVANHLAAMGFA